MHAPNINQKICVMLTANIGPLFTGLSTLLPYTRYGRFLSKSSTGCSASLSCHRSGLLCSPCPWTAAICRRWLHIALGAFRRPQDTNLRKGKFTSSPHEQEPEQFLSPARGRSPLRYAENDKLPLPFSRYAPPSRRCDDNQLPVAHRPGR